MRQRGVSEYSLKCIRWSVYRRIVVWHHTHDTDICSYELLSSLCELQRIRYEHGEISRKFYRAFVTAAFRIRSYVDTGKVDFSIVKDTKYYKPGKEYQELVDSILKASGLTEGSQYKLAIIMRQFFCFFEKRYSSIEQATVADGLFCREIDGLFCRSSPDIIVRRRCVLSHKRRGWLQPSPSFRYSRNLALQDELYHPVINNGPAVLVCVDKRLGTGPVNQSRDAG